ncbi:hypothetical protein CXF72_14950 [Psychromonas sp. MB-3u-54]|uniref:sulfotransferase family protein n=1 Tax=Psychromonas sp. MB-3u-54 TaxID=2058319 RepID=UPI000C34E1D0|nr:sulfotransferase [Psychromonas sp. MB-3u-54]PKH01855.1 hypothetical protein CXF72_14950 [Psychromonas sp. MB-3u-54]
MKGNILIIGAPRSGTTLLSGLVTGNEKCVPNIPECTYITQIVKHYHDIVNYSDKERFSIYAKDQETLLGVYKKHVDNMLEVVLSQFRNVNYDALVLKDPELSLYVDLVSTFFHKSKIIYIVRDPRAIIASMLKVFAKKNSGLFGANGYCSDETLLQVASDIYNYFYVIHESRAYKDGMIHIVGYEDIVEGDLDVFVNLEKYLGYKLSRKAFERNAFEFDENDSTFSKNYGQDIVKCTSDYRDSLCPKHIKVIEEMFSGLNLIYNWWG